MASFNQVILVGNLTKDPDTKFTPSGTAVCNFRMATNRKFKRGDAWEEEVTYIGVECWGKQAEACGEHLKKGASILVDGRLKMGEWTDKDTGKKIQSLSVVAERVQFLGGKRGQSEDEASNTHSAPKADEPSIPF